MHTHIDFLSYQDSVPSLLSGLQAEKCFQGQSPIVIKPNLINDSPPPITTPVQCCQAIVAFIRSCSDARIIVAEGCGQPELDTRTIFDRLGYTELAQTENIDLVDLNTAELVQVSNPTPRVFSQMYIPRIVMDSFLVSVPVLKAHSLAGMTGSLKNMIGVAPPEYYSGRHGSWKKAAFHKHMQDTILDLVSCRAPDLSLLDASVGMAEYHLGGPTCDPPVGRLVAGFDPWEVDRGGAGLLGLDWRRIGHLQIKTGYSPQGPQAEDLV